jgi:hypothetical protein
MRPDGGARKITQSLRTKQTQTISDWTQFLPVWSSSSSPIRDLRALLGEEEDDNLTS